MVGIVSCPVVITFVTTLPLMDPISPLAKIATLADPPRTCPRVANARLIKTAAARTLKGRAKNEEANDNLGKCLKRQTDQTLTTHGMVGRRLP